MSPRAKARARPAGSAAALPLPESRNDILSRIPTAERARIMEHAREVDHPQRELMFEQGDPIDKVHFPLTGMASLVIVLGDGTTIEALTVGREGFIGLPLLNQVTTARFKGICQIAGKFLVLDTAVFLSMIDEMPGLLLRLQRYSQYSSEVAAQSAACNSVHNLEQRCARWLLITSDAVADTTFDLTQEFLSQMLAVRRPGVTVAMAALAKRELVSYKYRTVTLLDVPGLEKVSCECYATISGKARELLN